MATKVCSVAQPRPQGFSLKKIQGFSLFPPHPFLREKVERSRVDRHQGRRVGRQKLPSSERGQNDKDRGKTRDFKQRDSKVSYLPRRRRARKDVAQIP